MPLAETTRRSLLAAAAMLAMPASAQAQKPVPPPLAPNPFSAEPFVIGGGPVGAAYDALGVAIAKLLVRTVPGLSATSAVTKGGFDNVDRVTSGQADIGFTQVDIAVNAVDGEGHYRGKHLPVRALGVMFPNHLHLVTTSRSGIRTMAELRGKRVSTGGPPGSAIEDLAYRALTIAGLDRNSDLASIVSQSLADSNAAVKAGTLDAYFFPSGIPAPAVTSLGATPGVKLVLVDTAALANGFIARYGPVYFSDVIPAGTYPGQDTDNQQMSVANIIIVSSAMPDARVTAILSALWANRPELVAAHPEATHFSLAAQRTAAVGVPWHPAAAAFWKAHGAQLA